MTLDQLRGNWNYPTSVRFGIGRIDELPEVCCELGIDRPLLVTDEGLASLPFMAKIVEGIRAAGLTTQVFSEVKPNPVWANVEKGLAAYREGGHNGVIAIGGGSPLDVGKSIAFMIPQTRPIWDFEDIGDNFKRATSNGIPPIIAVPTTAGTGSEVGRGTVITDETTHTKKIIFHPRMLPAVAILDPELTVGMSPRMTAGTGLDALAHNLEAYCAPFFHPMADGIGAEGVRLVKEYLPRAYADGSDLEARSWMLASAAMGATAFQKGLGAIHALSHPVGALYNTHHGLTNGVFLPYVLEFNRTEIEDRICRLASYLDLRDSSFSGFIDWTLELRRLTATPHTLQELGVGNDRFEEMSRMAEVDPPAFGNPRPLPAAAALGLYQRSYSGTLDLS